MNRSMSSIRLEIDGSISRIIETDPSSLPQIVVPPFLASISSISSEESARRRRRKKRNDQKKLRMSRQRYNYLCGNILVILMVEISILLSILVALNCSFYSVSIKDEFGEIVNLDLGLFRFSMSKESSLQRPQCTFYEANSMMDTLALERLLETTIVMLNTSQAFAITAPAVAGAVCVGLVFNALKPQRLCGRWQTIALLLFPALFQLLAVVFFDGESLCNSIPDARVIECGSSTGSKVCILAMISYIVAMVLCCFTPAVNAAETNNSKKKEHNCGTAPTTGNDKEQNQHHKRAAIANANEVSNVNIQKIDAYDVCCTPSPQMEDVADQSDNEDDVERNVSFETSVTEPTCSSPSREKEFTCSVASDVNHIANSMPKDRPYDEDCLVHINHRDKVQCEVAFNAAILQDLAQIDQEKSNSESENSHSSMHNDLVFDLM